MVGARTGFNGSGLYATAVGRDTKALGHASIAIGGGFDDTGNNAARAGGYRAIAIGQNSVSDGFFGTAVGYHSNANLGATAIGTDSNASAEASSALGRFSRAHGLNSVAIGGDSLASGNSSSALGRSSTAHGHNSVAIGGGVDGSSGALADGLSSIAIGLRSLASADSAAALGVGARATRQRSVALGSGSVANVVDTVSVGSDKLKRRIVNVAPAVNPTDAVNLAQLQAATAATTAAANMQAAGNTQQEVTALRTLVEQLEARIMQLERRAAARAE
jgi:autotransporter adhesin